MASRVVEYYTFLLLLAFAQVPISSFYATAKVATSPEPKTSASTEFEDPIYPEPITPATVQITTVPISSFYATSPEPITSATTASKVTTAAEARQADTDCKRSENVVAVIVLAAVLTVVLVLNVVAVIWFWRRGWTFPCADNKHQRHTELNQPKDTSEKHLTPVAINGSEDYLTPVTTNGSNRGEGEGPRQYETLRLEDVGMRSPYAEIQQEINTQEISHYEVL